MRGRVCFAWQFLCYHFVFVFSAGGQQIGRWGPEALGRDRVWGAGDTEVASTICSTVSLRAEATVWESHWHSGYHWGFLAQTLGHGGGQRQAQLPAAPKESPAQREEGPAITAEQKRLQW